MEVVMGLVGDGFTIIAANMAGQSSIMTIKPDVDKIHTIGKKMLMGAVGPQSDVVNFVEYIGKNIELLYYRNSYHPSAKATCNFVRNELAHALRSRPYQVDLLLGCYDEAEGPSLHFVDYLASMQDLKYAAHGYSAYFAHAMMDTKWRPSNPDECTKEHAIALLKEIIDCLQKRFIINLGQFQYKIIDQNGVECGLL